MDVDARIEYAKDEVLAAAEEQDLDPNWLNENADCSCRRPRDDRTRTFFNAPGLVVTGAPAEHMLAMKIDAARNSRRGRHRRAGGQLGITSADQAFEIHRTVLPHTAAVDARRRELVSKIVDERVRNRR